MPWQNSLKSCRFHWIWNNRSVGTQAYLSVLAVVVYSRVKHW